MLAVAKFSSEAEATQLANDTSYGLGAGVFSSDANQCMRMASALEAGTVWVNNYVALSNAVPFGGFKASGMGRELGVDAIKVRVPLLCAVAQSLCRQLMCFGLNVCALLSNRSTRRYAVNHVLRCAPAPVLNHTILRCTSQIKSMHFNYGEKLDWPLPKI